MKSMFFVLTVLSSVSSFAATENYSVGPAYVVQTQPGQDIAADEALCPQVKSASVQVKDGALTTLGLSLAYEDGSTVVFSANGSSRTCYSDIVCPTTDDFSSVDKNVFVMLTRNNDGNYPTTDQAGHNALAILATVGSKSLACYYTIQ